MHVIKATGLVPVKAKVAVDNFSAGTVFGMKPEDARKAITAGFVELIQVPNNIEVDVVAGPAAEPTAQVPIDEDGEAVSIPDDWATQHHLFRMALAKKISGADVPRATDEQKANGTTTVDLADEIIAAEVARRAAADNSEE